MITVSTVLSLELGDDPGPPWEEYTEVGRGTLYRAEPKHECSPPGPFLRMAKRIHEGDRWMCGECSTSWVWTVPMPGPYGGDWRWERYYGNTGTFPKD